MEGSFATVGDAELLQQLVELLAASLAVGLDELEHGHDVLLDGQAAEDRRFLRQIADAEAGALVHRQARDVAAVDGDAAFVGGYEAGDHVEDGGLAGAVGAEQADRLATTDGEADAFDDRSLLVGLLDGVNGQPAFGGDRLGAVVVSVVDGVAVVVGGFVGAVRLIGVGLIVAIRRVVAVVPRPLPLPRPVRVGVVAGRWRPVLAGQRRRGRLHGYETGQRRSSNVACAQALAAGDGQARVRCSCRARVPARRARRTPPL